MVALVTGVLSALVALICALWAARTSRAVAQLQAATAQELAESANSRLDRERAEELQRKIAQYREPLARAAYDLQARLYNSLKKNYLGHLVSLGDAERAYAINNTLFVFSEYFGWVEILRRETEYLNFADSEYDRSLATALLAIDVIMSGGDDRENLDFRVYRGQQRAIGELMTTQRPADADKPTCLGYARFSKRLHDDPEFRSWLSPLEEDIHRMAAGENMNTQRLRDLQAALVNLLQFIDDPPRRFDRNVLSKVDA